MATSRDSHPPPSATTSISTPPTRRRSTPPAPSPPAREDFRAARAPARARAAAPARPPRAAPPLRRGLDQLGHAGAGRPGRSRRRPAGGRLPFSLADAARHEVDGYANQGGRAAGPPRLERSRAGRPSGV